ncbi:DMT family transporter [Sutcliffiella horikoshii]|uniref:DMT family transporter n=1 Tax=Sutcliffiella horikoshii TaxID=79883 RepID=UPI001F460A74|nr:DMT family transporter [Sutcliffiella horikoshii]MCG1023570.1 DMT family transporter [Sutcliffiella horikoshii]
MDNIKKGYYLNFLSVVMMAIGPLVSKFGLLHISPGKAALINTVTIIVVSYLWGVFTKNTVTFYVEKEVILLALFNACGVIFLFMSMDLLSPVEVGFLGRFYTVFAVVLSVFILKEKMTKTEIIFIVLALFGAFMFVGEGADWQASLVGSLFAILYTFFFALTNVYIKKTLTIGRESNSILFTNNCITAIFVLVYSMLAGELFDPNYPVNGVLLIVLSSIITGFLGTILLYEALKYLRFSIANISRALSPLLLAVISFPFFPIKLTIWNVTGAILLMVSVLLLSVGEKKKQGKEEK